MIEQDAALQADAEPIALVTGAPAAGIERDAHGRTTADGRHSYTYTLAGQIETVSDPQDRLIGRYRYNGAGQRVSKTAHMAQGPSGGDQMPHGIALTPQAPSGRRTSSGTTAGLVAEIEGSGERQGSWARSICT